jgi:hypothetical protein
MTLTAKGLLDGASTDGVRIRPIIMERVRPMRWLWRRRIPVGVPSLIVGEEGMGKGTTAAWIIARATRGELEGDFAGQPLRVLVIGDEDAFEPIWVPRLEAAGADLSMMRTLDDGEYLDDLGKSAEGLAKTLEAEQIGFVLLDQLLDHIPAGDNGGGIYNPKSVRQALLPLRRIAGERDIAALGLLHPIKGNVTSFRQLLAGSHQFNAISRSSLLLGEDPDDDSTRVLVRGKGNHSAAPKSFEFRIAPERVELNGHEFEVPRVVGEHEGERTVRDLLAGGPKAPVREPLADQLAGLLTVEPQTQADLARAADRPSTDGSVRRALLQLEKDGRAKRGWLGARQGWQSPDAKGKPASHPLTGVAGCSPIRPVVPGDAAPPACDCSHADDHRDRWRSHPVTGRPVCPTCHPTPETG